MQKKFKALFNSLCGANCIYINYVENNTRMKASEKKIEDQGVHHDKNSRYFVLKMIFDSQAHYYGSG